jgi:hypothetical protein
MHINYDHQNKKTSIRDIKDFNKKFPLLPLVTYILDGFGELRTPTEAPIMY